MDSCLLCLEINKDCIMENSTRWQELDITKVIEKHFWPLNTIYPSSSICLSCWQKVDCFHKFYLGIEYAHVNFGKIKVDVAVSVVCKEEPEILEYQAQAEPEMIVQKPPPYDLAADKEIAFGERIDVLDLEDIPLNQVRKRLRLQSGLANRDPLKKSKQRRNFKSEIPVIEKSTETNTTEDIKVKEEQPDLSDNDSKIIGDDSDNDSSDINYQPDEQSSENSDNEKGKVCNRPSKSRKHNDQFIVEKFKLLGFEFICDLCKTTFEDHISMRKHFVNAHNQSGYVVCCNKKIYKPTRLVDHLHRHLNPDYFKCNECGKPLSNRSTLLNHTQRVHWPDEFKQYSCNVCGKSFVRESERKFHELSHPVNVDERLAPLKSAYLN